MKKIFILTIMLMMVMLSGCSTFKCKGTWELYGDNLQDQIDNDPPIKLSFVDDTTVNIYQKEVMMYLLNETSDKTAECNYQVIDGSKLKLDKELKDTYDIVCGIIFYQGQPIHKLSKDEEFEVVKGHLCTILKSKNNFDYYAVFYSEYTPLGSLFSGGDYNIKDLSDLNFPGTEGWLFLDVVKYVFRMPKD